MKVLIFNSGLGNRMGEFTKTHHKSMAVLHNGETILERQIRILSSLGLKEYIITTGPFENQIVEKTRRRDFKGLNFTFVKNAVYDKTNYIYSMYLAKEHFNDDFIIIHGDLVFNENYAKKVLLSEYSDLGSVNFKAKLPEKDFKARVIDGRLREVSINIFDEDCFAFQPFYKLSKSTLNSWLDRVSDFVDAGNDKVYAENALNEILAELNVVPFSYDEDFVDEVDNIDDLQRVSNYIKDFDYVEQKVYSGDNSYKKIADILKANNVQKPMLVVDSAFDYLSIKDYFKTLSYDFVKFSDFSPNPKYEEVVAGLKVFQENKCDFIVVIGGGSAIDTAKNIKLFSALDDNEVYFRQEYKYSDIGLIAIPTTAGTGSESTRFSVLYYNGEKQSIAHDCIIPNYVILEASVLKTLPLYQKKCTVMDAFCQCIESIWSINSTTISREYAVKGIRLFIEYIDRYLNGDEASLDKIMLAANYSGRAINISQTTAGHAMSYKLSSIFNIPHGHAVVLCLLPVWRYMINVANTSETEDVIYLKNAFNVIKTAFGVDDIEDAYNYLYDLRSKMELDIAANDASVIDVLVKSVNAVRLANNPLPLNEKNISDIYLDVLNLR